MEHHTPSFRYEFFPKALKETEIDFRLDVSVMYFQLYTELVFT